MLDLLHRRDEASALRVGQRLEERLRQRVAAAVEHGPLGRAGGGEAGGTHPLVVFAGAHLDQTVALERAQQPAQVAGVQIEPGSQRADLAAGITDLPEHTCLSERTVAGEVAVVEGADALGDDPVEAAHPIDRRPIHSLTIVRELGGGKAGWPPVA